MKQNYTNKSCLFLIEDEESIAKPLVKLMSFKGYQVDWAPDAIQGLQQLRSMEALPDCLLVDIMMPGMSGWEFRDEQLRNAKLRDIPLIFLSADNRSEKDAKMRGDIFVSKPIDLEHLDRMIQAELSRRQNAILTVASS